MPSGRFFLGVDGGQSSTQAVIGDLSGNILGRATGGPCNHAAAGAGEAKLRGVMRALLRDVVTAAGLPADTVFEGACFAMSGGADDKRAVLKELTPAESLEVTIDATGALEGATGGGAGIVVIAGTGSIALGRDASGAVVRIGGWGYVFGDEGSAFDIVRRALRAALGSEEGWSEPTRLKDVLLEATESKTVNEALHRFYTPDWPRDRIATIAPRVDRLAECGDTGAKNVLQECGRALGSMALRVAGALPNGAHGLTVYPCGGVFVSELIHYAFVRAVEDSQLPVKRPQHDAAIGALLIAYRLAGMRVSIQRPGDG